MEKNEIVKALLEDLHEMTQANLEMATALRELKDNAEKNINAYREELHAAKGRVEATEAQASELRKRCDRLQEKYDALHEKYDRLVEKSIDKTGGGSRADVKVNM